MDSTLPSEASCLIACPPHICFLEQRRGSLQRAPSGVWGMCAHIWGESLRRGLAGVVYFQRVVLRMCWEVEELRELSALWFGFHLPGTQLGVGGGGGGGCGERVFRQQHKQDRLLFLSVYLHVCLRYCTASCMMLCSYHIYRKWLPNSCSSFCGLKCWVRRKKTCKKTNWTP